ncbi:MAG: hypothetical protein QNJ73_01975 [Gammaproteobacteria bacterium]|nr:hypothetical protein [Gammaproteobacteria bacterium]
MNSTQQEQHSDFERRAAGLLRDSVEDLDAATRSKLNRARQAALDELSSARRLTPLWGVLTAAAVGAIAISLWRAAPDPTAPGEIPTATTTPELEVIFAEENLDMLEDLEFYVWLAAESMDMEAAG